MDTMKDEPEFSTPNPALMVSDDEEPAFVVVPPPASAAPASFLELVLAKNWEAATKHVFAGKAAKGELFAILKQAQWPGVWDLSPSQDLQRFWLALLVMQVVVPSQLFDFKEANHEFPNAWLLIACRGTDEARQYLFAHAKAHPLFLNKLQYWEIKADDPEDVFYDVVDWCVFKGEAAILPFLASVFEAGAWDFTILKEYALKNKIAEDAPEPLQRAWTERQIQVLLFLVDQSSALEKAEAQKPESMAAEKDDKEKEEKEKPAEPKNPKKEEKDQNHNKQFKFVIGQRVMCKDSMRRICLAEIVKCELTYLSETPHYYVHYVHWGSQYDAWMTENLIDPCVVKCDCNSSTCPDRPRSSNS